MEWEVVVQTLARGIFGAAYRLISIESEAESNAFVAESSA
jgi:hypothetical protein